MKKMVKRLLPLVAVVSMLFGLLVPPAFANEGPQFSSFLSSLPGWQEGAIASALNAISRLTQPDLSLPYLKALPDTRLMVEGI